MNANTIDTAALGELYTTKIDNLKRISSQKHLC